MPVRRVDSFAARSSTSSVLRQGSRGPYVTQLQQLLRAKGYRISADGVFGPGTAAAVRAFQRSRRLSADGVVGPKTWAALRAGASKPAASSGGANGVLRMGARGSQVVALQQALRNKGYRISADGDFGARTLAAVKAFQRSRRLPADGVVGPKTWAALRSGGAAPVSTPSAGPGVPATGYRNGRPVRLRIAAVGNGKYLNARAAGPYKAMLAAARRAGIRLSTVSGFRTYSQQAYLYRLYKSGRGNLAARPGYSNHQMGLSVDIGGVGSYRTRAFKWLQANAPRYGFVNDVRGEYWHWTYRR